MDGVEAKAVPPDRDKRVVRQNSAEPSDT